MVYKIVKNSHPTPRFMEMLATDIVVRCLQRSLDKLVKIRDAVSPLEVGWDIH